MCGDSTTRANWFECTCKRCETSLCYRHANEAIDNEKKGTKFEKHKQKGDSLLTRAITMQPHQEEISHKRKEDIGRENTNFLGVLDLKVPNTNCILSKKGKSEVFLLSPNYDLCRCVVIAQRGLTDSNTHAKHVEPDCAMPARCQ